FAVALAPCRECGEEISTQAATCPNCGINSPARKPVGFLGAVLNASVYAIGLLLIFLVVPAILSGNRKDAPTKSFGQELKETGGCNSSVAQQKAAQRVIQSSGYDCRSVDAMCPYVLSEGATVHCNNGRYKFELENHGGIWSVKAD